MNKRAAVADWNASVPTSIPEPILGLLDEVPLRREAINDTLGGRTAFEHDTTQEDRAALEEGLKLFREVERAIGASRARVVQFAHVGAANGHCADSRDRRSRADKQRDGGSPLRRGPAWAAALAGARLLGRSVLLIDLMAPASNPAPEDTGTRRPFARTPHGGTMSAVAEPGGTVPALSEPGRGAGRGALTALALGDPSDAWPVTLSLVDRLVDLAAGVDIVFVACSFESPNPIVATLAPRMDATVLVVQAGTARATAVQRAAALLRSCSASVPGVVLTGCRRGRPFLWSRH